MSQSDVDISNALLEEQEALETHREAQRHHSIDQSQNSRDDLESSEELVRDAQSKLSVLTAAERKGYVPATNLEVRE